MAEMKDSGIEWIGKIPKNWIVSRLKYELETSMKYGASEAGVEYSDDLPRYIRITDITNNNRLKTEGKVSLTEKQANGYMLEKDTVLFARSGGTVGKTFLYKPKYGKAAFVGYLISAIPDKKKMQAEWLYYYSLSNAYWDWANQIFTQATIQNIGADKYSNLPIPIPSIDIQNAIVNYLDKKCAEIDTLYSDIEKQIHILEEYKKSIITEAVTRGLDPDVEMKDSGSVYWKDIPANWKLSDIKYLFEIVKKIAGKEGYDILSVTQKGLKIKDISRNEGQIAESYANYQFVYPTDYVMNHMDLLTGWVDCSKYFGVTSPDYRVFRLKDKKNNLNYYKYIMQCCYMDRIFYSLGQGVSNLGRWRLQTESFNNFQIPVPPAKEQEQIAKYLDEKCIEIENIILDKQQQLETLEQYKKSLIYEYVTGKKEVK